MTNKFVFITLMVLLFFSPFPHGLELLYQSMLVGAVLFFLLTILLVANPERSLLKLKTHVFILAAGLVILLYNWSKVFIDVPDYISISPSHSFIVNLSATIVFAFYGIIIIVINNWNQLKVLSVTLISAAFFTATYSLINHYNGGASEVISAIPPWGADWSQVVRGTFSYKNHYASYLAMTILISIGLLISRLDLNKSLTYNFSNPTSIVIALITALLLFTYLKTGSRGSFFVFIFVLLIWFAFVVARQGFGFRSRKLVYAAILMVPVFLAIFNSATYQRFSDEGISANGRDLMYNTVKHIVEKENILFGTGPGTYPLVQHKYKQPELSITGMSKRAHNDYLETFTNMGIVGVGLISLLVLLIVMTYTKNNIKKKRRHNALVTGYKAAACYLVLHGMFDFNLSLMALSLLFVLCIHISLVGSSFSRREGHRIAY